MVERKGRIFRLEHGGVLMSFTKEEACIAIELLEEMVREMFEEQQASHPPSQCPNGGYADETHTTRCGKCRNLTGDSW